MSQLISDERHVSHAIRLGTGSGGVPGPKITAFQSIMLSGHGLPEIPEGGSVESLLKSRIRRRLQFVDCREHVSVKYGWKIRCGPSWTVVCGGCPVLGKVAVAERDWPLLVTARDRDLSVTDLHQQWTVALLGISAFFPFS